jgi:hypothetical protein
MHTRFKGKKWCTIDIESEVYFCHEPMGSEWVAWLTGPISGRRESLSDHLKTFHGLLSEV